MKTQFLFAGVTVLLAGSGAYAADLASPAVAPSPVVSSAPSWTGAYLGAQAGYSWGNAPSPEQGWTDTANGAKLGVFAGYNYNLGGAVVGAEIGGNWLNATGSVVTGGIASETFKLDQNWEGSLVGRLGLPVAENVLLYALAGGSVTGLTGQYIETVPPNSPSASATVWGWTAGVGAEYKLSDTLSVRGEYRFARYGNADLTCSTCGTTTVNLTTNAATVGLLAHW